MKQKIAIYLRVSTKDKGQDTENQLAQLETFVSKIEDWEIYKIYKDQQSAKKGSDREQFKLMFADASKRLFDVVLFWSLDRFSREGVLETLKHLELLSSYKVSWKSYTEQYLDSTGVFKDAVIAILATIAKQEQIRISERVQAGLAIARKKGVKLGRKQVAVNKDRVVIHYHKSKSYEKTAKSFGVGRMTALS